ncbi:MAG: MmgE/PrpD family protein [Candidatus Rokubacteria bacterium]|nr:MmgE/PrpD family protein [Candidatus Rokubacteria bacterium]
MPSPTRELAEFVAGLRFEHLPDAVVRQACDVVLDTLGCCVSAWEQDPEKARIACGLAQRFGSRGAATVVGAGGVTADPALAALANGILANAADADDTHKRALLHTGSVVVSTALALAEARGLSGPALLTALVAGYEVAVRVGMAVMPTHYRFWHSTATNGTFGGAAAAAAALGLDADGAQRALGHAGTQAAGLNTFFESGDFTKSLHPGKAAFNGILSAYLAEQGATSPPTMLEHPKGYLHAYSLEPRPEALTAGLGRTWEILQNGFKYFPSILASHAPVQATLAIVGRHRMKPEEIAGITNETYSTVKTHFSNKLVDTVMGARVSVPYCIAVAAVDGALGQAQFAPSRIRDRVVQDVLARTDVVADPELTALYPDKFPARVTITLTDGRKLQETRHFPKGDPHDPLTPAEIEDKFVQNLAFRFSEAEARGLAALIRDLPRTKDVRAVIRPFARS